MSYYTRFADVESLLSATTTTVLAQADVMLVYSNTDNKYHTATVGALGGSGGVAQSITTSTASGFQVINAYGSAIITAAATGGVAILSPPTVAGIDKTIALSATSTTTGFQVITSSTNYAMFTTGASSNTISPCTQLLFAEPSSWVTMTSMSTSQWLITGQAATPGIARTTTTAT